MGTHDTEAFARRLAELREASGRSYGALARRMGVSASTLHRYCSGHTVPLEFAPIERLARLCGCRGEELVALHRLWVLADADRRRRQDAAAVSGAQTGTDSSGGADGTGAASAPEGRSGKSSPAPAHNGGPETTGPKAPPVKAAEAAPQTEAVPESDQTARVGEPKPRVERASGAAGLPTPADPAPAGATSADPASAGPTPADPVPERPILSRAPQPEAQAQGSDAGRPRADAGPADGPPEATVVLGAGVPRRRRRAVYATAAAVVTTVTLVLLLAFDRSPLHGVNRERATVGQPDGVKSTWPSAMTPDGRRSSPSPSKSPSSGSVTATSSSRPSPVSTGPTGSAAASAGSATKAPPLSGTPFSWSLDQHVWENGCGHAYLVDRPLSAVPPPPAESDAEPWAGSLGAVHGGETMVRITVQGKSDQAVVLQSLRVRVTAKRTPPKGNVYLMSVGCGGSITPRMFDVDLDRPRPLARSVAGSDAGVDIPAVSFPYRVSATDPEVLLVTGRAVGCDCDWYLELEWSSGDRKGTARIDDSGRPFRTSGVRGRPTYEYDTITRGWRPVESAESRDGADRGTPSVQGSPSA
ncbi:helix-turn-helix domain-containing protein [Streptomyces albipurpureus]|uniref:Helix-turn-helix domain-containing protein n=1 Tax=Streptomyces albipurpureus TaxID=2897419 RepID=A0ABT0UF07_9ACTN|nr:transcriptional regulator [Streptomyces sp. CWNU-1]MCM2386943.1 helix-turn-helix domain-containing protein [Streptomyces sp. CWNU-1]